MKINTGCIDRALRAVIGLALITMAATGMVGMWGWIGIIPLLTGLVGFCPTYTIMGINTCRVKK